jgi:hypothetical protein
MNLTDSWQHSLDGESARRNTATYTIQQKYRKKAHIHAFRGIRTNDHTVRAGEDTSCLRPHRMKSKTKHIFRVTVMRFHILRT